MIFSNNEIVVVLVCLLLFMLNDRHTKQFTPREGIIHTNKLVQKHIGSNFNDSRGE